MTVKTLRAAVAFVALAMLVADARQASAVTVRATLDRQSAGVGEQVVLGIEVQGADDTPPPDLGGIEGFTVRYLGPTTQVSIVQGRVSKSITHRYALFAKRAGRFTLGPFVVSAGGQSYQTTPLRVQVVVQTGAESEGVPPRAADGPDLALVLETPKREPFLHERIPISITLYVGEARVDDVQYPQIEGDSFSFEPFGKPVQGRVRRGGKTYQTVRFDTSIVPLRAGTLTLGPAVESLSVVTSRQERDPFFGRFFGADILTERRPREIHSNAETLTVRPLPEVGRPPDFSGAVGEFDLEVSARPTELQANDPITLTIHITGTGNLSGISPPAVGGPGFKTYPARSLKAEEGTGTRVLEQVVIPTDEAVRELPEVRFTYFDPESGVYRTAARGPIPLVVRPAREEVDTASGRTRETVDAKGAESRAEKLGRDIVYVKDTPGRMYRGGPLYLSPVFLAAQVLPLCGYLLAFSVARRRERLRGDPRYARFALAGKEARRAIAAARHRAAGGEAPAVYDGLARAVREYLSAKLDLPPGAVDAERVAERLGGRESPVVPHVEEFFRLIEHVSYARAVDGGADRRAAVDLAEQIVRDLERQRGLAERFGKRRQVGVISLAVSLGFGVTAITAAGVMAVDTRTSASTGDSTGMSAGDSTGMSTGNSTGMNASMRAGMSADASGGTTAHPSTHVSPGMSPDTSPDTSPGARPRMSANMSADRGAGPSTGTSVRTRTHVMSAGVSPGMSPDTSPDTSPGARPGMSVNMSADTSTGTRPGMSAGMSANMSAEHDPSTRFFEANALYKAGRYQEAATGYEALVEAGFESGALNYNLGNAFFKAGELGRAVLSYERARRLLPRDPDVRANLRFAQQQVAAGAAATPAPPPLWLRLTVPLAFYASTVELAVATSAAYVILMLLLTLRLFLPESRRVLGRAAAVAGFVIVVTGSACGLRLVDEHVRTTAVIVSAGEVPVRFEPSDTGTVHFALSEGVLVRALDMRDGWYQIARADGRRGWIAAGAIEVL